MPRTDGSVQSVERALEVLEEVARSSSGLGISELSARTKLGKSTVHRLITALRLRGFVVQDRTSGKYKLGIRLFEVGSLALRQMGIETDVLKVIEDLCEAYNETINLAVLDHTDIIYVAQAQSSRPLRMGLRVGTRVPAYCSALGKAILAYMPREEARRIFEASSPRAYTPNTIIDTEIFLAHLDRIRRIGYSIDNEEYFEGIRCVGAPIIDKTGKVQAAISLAGPSIRITMDRMETIAEDLKAAAEKIARGFAVGLAI
ncbi:MAG TPA: IclR family transcriptional regulator [Clostridia bacterium]|nr:IclR family transcriptional regulator [Clostridia bacterium]